MTRTPKEGGDYQESGRTIEDLLGNFHTTPPLIDSEIKATELTNLIKNLLDSGLIKKKFSKAIDAIIDLYLLSFEHKTIYNEEKKKVLRNRMGEIAREKIYKEIGASKMELEETLQTIIQHHMPTNYNPRIPVEEKEERRRYKFINRLIKKIIEDEDNKKLITQENLEFYSSINTPLDILFSTDGFFKIKGIAKKDIYISLDLTKRSKEPHFKVLIYQITNPDDEQLTTIETDLAKQIVLKILETKEITNKESISTWTDPKITEEVQTATAKRAETVIGGRSTYTPPPPPPKRGRNPYTYPPSKRR